eukprot:6345097-Alexandrium_andersonii.AAC.1
MSASLVGSEMCIRDRICCRSLLMTPVFGRSVPLPASCVRCSHWRGLSVSYTHLTLPTICSV